TTIDPENSGPIVADVWYGDRSLSATEADNFGKYGSEAKQLDDILFNAPNLLSIWSAGNDRGGAITGGATQYVAFFSSATTPDGTLPGFTVPGFYLVSTSVLAAPGTEGNNGAGFDSLPGGGQVAKNTLVVGAIDDVTADPYPALGMGT